MVNPTVSLSQLDARKASEVEFEFPYLLDGAETGVFFSVIGGQAERVTSALEKLVDDQRRRTAVAEIKARTGGKKDEPVFTPYKEDVDFAASSGALRLTGWRGITEPFSPELALSLCASNNDVVAQIMVKSNNMANFIKLSPPK